MELTLEEGGRVHHQSHVDKRTGELKCIKCGNNMYYMSLLILLALWSISWTGT